MWSGWLAGTAIWALFTTALVAEQVTCNWCWAWGSVFIVTYVFWTATLLFSMWPIIRYRTGFTPKDSDAGNDIAKENIDSARKMLWADVGTIVFSVIMSGLVLTTFILLAINLDGQRHGDSPDTAPSAVFASITILAAIIAYCITKIQTQFSSNKDNNDDAAASFSLLFACCHTPAYDLDHRRHERAPAWFGDYPLYSWATSLYNITLPVAASFIIISLLLSIDFFDSGSSAEDLAVILWPFWVALALLTIATLILVVVTLRDGDTPCYDVFVLAFSIIIYIGFFWTSLWLLKSDSLPPHVIVSPVYVVLSLSAIIFAIGQVWRCQTSYRIIVDDDTHHADHVDRFPDGVRISTLLRDVVATSISSRPPSSIVSVHWPDE